MDKFDYTGLLAGIAILFGMSIVILHASAIEIHNRFLEQQKRQRPKLRCIQGGRNG